MDFYGSSSFPHENDYYTQIPYDNRYNYSYYYPPPESSAHFSSYEVVPTQSRVAYSTCHDSYSNPVSTQYVVYHHSVALDEDLDFEEYDPLPFGGGYDIVQTYGKPLEPSDEICHPRSSSGPQEQDAQNLKSGSQVTEEKDVVEEEEEEVVEEEEVEEEPPGDGGGLDEGRSADSVQVYEGVREYNTEVANQIPPGYGLEAFDICENLFGYWPCLSRMKKKCPACGRENGVRCGTDLDQWNRTADYLFGNPNPYAGCMDQAGYSSANPVHFYQMQQHQPPATLYYHADQYSQNPWLL